MSVKSFITLGPARHFGAPFEGRACSQGDHVAQVEAVVGGAEVRRHEKIRLGRKQF